MDHEGQKTHGGTGKMRSVKCGLTEIGKALRGYCSLRVCVACTLAASASHTEKEFLGLGLRNMCFNKAIVESYA